METWKQIIGYEWLYEISSIWRVKSFQKWRNFIMKPWKTNHYSWISLSGKPEKINYLIHRLVAQHFIPNPDNLPCVLHIKEDLDENGMLYNWEDNLYWGTYKENTQDMYNKWRSKNHFKTNHPHKWLLWKNHFLSKKVNQYTKDLKFIKTWDCISDIERILWIDHPNISACCKWKYKSAGWYVWKYINSEELLQKFKS